MYKFFFLLTSFATLSHPTHPFTYTSYLILIFSPSYRGVNSSSNSSKKKWKWKFNITMMILWKCKRGGGCAVLCIEKWKEEFSFLLLLFRIFLWPSVSNFFFFLSLPSCVCICMYNVRSVLANCLLYI